MQESSGGTDLGKGGSRSGLLRGTGSGRRHFRRCRVGRAQRDSRALNYVRLACVARNVKDVTFRGVLAPVSSDAISTG